MSALRFALTTWLTAILLTLSISSHAGPTEAVNKVLGNHGLRIVESCVRASQHGNCWPLSVATALREKYPKSFKRLFEQTQESHLAEFADQDFDSMDDSIRSRVVRNLLINRLRKLLENPEQTAMLLRALQDIHYHNVSPEVVGIPFGTVHQLLLEAVFGADTPDEASNSVLFGELQAHGAGVYGDEMSLLLAVTLNKPIVVFTVSMNFLTVVTIHPAQTDNNQDLQISVFFYPISDNEDGSNIELNPLILQTIPNAGAVLLHTPGHAQLLVQTMPNCECGSNTASAGFAPTLNGAILPTSGGPFIPMPHRKPVFDKHTKFKPDTHDWNRPATRKKPIRQKNCCRSTCEKLAAVLLPATGLGTVLALNTYFNWLPDLNTQLWKVACGNHPDLSTCMNDWRNRSWQAACNNHPDYTGCMNAWQQWGTEQALWCQQQVCGDQDTYECLKYYLPGKK